MPDVDPAHAWRRIRAEMRRAVSDSTWHLWLEPLEATPNLTRLMVPGEADVQAVVVTLDPAAAKPFRFELIGEAGVPPQRPPCAGYTSSMRSTRSG